MNTTTNDSIEVQTYFQNNPAVDRAKVEASAAEANMSLHDYCRLIMSLQAVRDVCIQSVGVTISVILAKQTGEVILREATGVVDKIWNDNADASAGADKMAARIILGCAKYTVDEMEKFLKPSEIKETD